jgi:hypothetical protein
VFSPDPLADVDAARVGYALAKCIAKKHVVGDPVLRRLDPLGNAAAIHTMALRMADELREEVEIVLGEVRLQLREAQGRALDAAMDEDGSAG